MSLSQMWTAVAHIQCARMMDCQLPLSKKTGNDVMAKKLLIMTIDIWEKFLFACSICKDCEGPWFSIWPVFSLLLLHPVPWWQMWWGCLRQITAWGDGRHKACPRPGNGHKCRLILVEVKLLKHCWAVETKTWFFSTCSVSHYASPCTELLCPQWNDCRSQGGFLEEAERAQATHGGHNAAVKATYQSNSWVVLACVEQK